MSDSLHRYALEQTVALGDELGIPMGRLMERTRKALGIPMDGDDEHPLAHLLGREPIEWDDFQLDSEIPGDTEETESTYLQDTPPADSNQVTPGILEIPKRKCRGLNKQGLPCGAYRLKGGDLCLFHESDAVTNLRDGQSRGGQATRKPLTEEMPLLDFNIFDRGGIQAVLGQIVRMQLLGVLPSRQVSQLVKVLGLIISNARDLPRHDAERRRFGNSHDTVLRLSDLIVERLNERDLVERTNAISDHRAKREEVLEANKTFGYGPPAKAPTRPSSPRIGYGPNDIRPFRG